jgi:hypothetical protein
MKSRGKLLVHARFPAYQSRFFGVIAPNFRPIVRRQQMAVSATLHRRWHLLAYRVVKH